MTRSSPNRTVPQMALVTIIDFSHLKHTPTLSPMASRRFPPPWTVEEQDACFVVRDHNEQALAYVYFEDEPWAKIGGKINWSATRRDELQQISRNCQSY